MKYIHNIDLKPEFIYDSWAICNFINEYDKKKNILPDKYVNKFQLLYNEYKNINMNNLQHTFVHGDIMNTNVMKDDINKLWIIDIAVSNYLPRITDLVVTMANLCTIKDNIEESINRISIFLKEYTLNNKLTKYEKANLKLFYEITNAMYVLQSSYQKSIGNISEENEYWFTKGCTGLEFSDKKEFIKVFDEL